MMCALVEWLRRCKDPATFAIRGEGPGYRLAVIINLNGCVNFGGTSDNWFWIVRGLAILHWADNLRNVVND